jgi:hypothetical protein
VTRDAAGQEDTTLLAFKNLLRKYRKVRL